MTMVLIVLGAVGLLAAFLAWCLCRASGRASRAEEEAAFEQAFLREEKRDG